MLCPCVSHFSFSSLCNVTPSSSMIAVPGQVATFFVIASSECVRVAELRNAGVSSSTSCYEIIHVASSVNCLRIPTSTSTGLLEGLVHSPYPILSTYSTDTIIVPWLGDVLFWNTERDCSLWRSSSPSGPVRDQGDRRLARSLETNR